MILNKRDPDGVDGFARSTLRQLDEAIRTIETDLLSPAGESQAS